MGARNHRRLVWGPVAALLGALAAASCFWEDGDPPPDLPPTASSVASVPGTLPPATAAPTAPVLPADIASAQVFYREGRYGEARSAFQLAAGRTKPGGEQAEAFLGAGNAAFSLNDAAAGFDAYRQAVEVAPAGSQVAVRARYLLLLQLNNAGRHTEAAALFNANPSLAGGSPLEPYYRFEGGRAQWWPAGNEMWLALLRDPAVSPALKTSIRQQSVTEWRNRGDMAGLVSALDTLIADTGDPAARLERAELASVAGDSRTASEQLRAIVANDPSSRYAGAALELARKLDVSIDPGVAGLSYYRRGAYRQAVDVLLPAIETAVTEGDLAFRAYYLAASYEDLGLWAEAVRFYDRAAAVTGASPYVHRAKYWAARVTERSGTASEASSRYVALATAGPQGEFTLEAAFRAGYVLFEAGDGAGALVAWSGLGAASSARMEYWRGRALAASADVSGARRAYERAVALGPFDFHGIEAARELGSADTFDPRFVERDLGKPVDWAAVASWLSGRVGGAAPGSAPTAACELMAAGLRTAATAEIWAAEARGGTWRRFELMREASECGLTDSAARLAVRIREEAGVASHQAPKDLLRVSYPVDYAGSLAVEAKKAGLDPLFFASLIRQESFWDPTAGSSAGALGLTQVILPTGEALAAELGVSSFNLDMLLRPALSLEFGAHYLAGQMAWSGDALVALAAYNAGPGNAARWKAGGAARPADLVEAIDFAETKSYVMLIFEAYAHYRLAWAE